MRHSAREGQRAQRQLVDALAVYRRSYGALASCVPELIAVRAGLKQAAQITLVAQDDVQQESRRMRAFCRATGLHWTPQARGERQGLLVSRNSPSTEDDHSFSYPQCCVEKYRDSPIEYYFVRGVGSLLTHGASYDFRVNPFLVSTPFHLLDHLPCSLGCEQTLAASRRLQAVLQKRAAELEVAIVHWNRRPALFVDVCGVGILFYGIFDGDRVAYEDFYLVGVPAELASMSPKNTPDDLLMFDRLVAALGEGDVVTLVDDALTVRIDDREVQRFTRPSHLAWSLVDFV